MNIIEKAIQIAVAAHKEQVRKSDGTPYVAHPLMVARILDKEGFNDEIVAAAVTHDVIEDTDVSESDLRERLGDEIVDIVMGVSENKDLPWEERKQLYINNVVTGSEEIKAVSIADKIHNAESLIDGHEAQGGKVWNCFNKPREQKLWFERTLLDEMVKNWDHPLVDRYKVLVEKLESLV